MSKIFNLLVGLLLMAGFTEIHASLLTTKAIAEMLTSSPDEDKHVCYSCLDYAGFAFASATRNLTSGQTTATLTVYGQSPVTVDDELANALCDRLQSDYRRQQDLSGQVAQMGKQYGKSY